MQGFRWLTCACVFRCLTELPGDDFAACWANAACLQGQWFPWSFGVSGVLKQLEVTSARLEKRRIQLPFQLTSACDQSA